MSFRAPKPPVLSSVSTPFKNRLTERTDTPLRRPYGLKGPALRPQVNFRIAGRKFALRRRITIEDTRRSPTNNRHSTPIPTEGALKRAAEHQHWCDVIGRLIPSYLDLLRRSKNLHTVDRSYPSSCACNDSTRSLDVTVISMNGMNYISLYIIIS